MCCPPAKIYRICTRGIAHPAFAAAALAANGLAAEQRADESHNRLENDRFGGGDREGVAERDEVAENDVHVFESLSAHEASPREGRSGQKNPL